MLQVVASDALWQVKWNIVRAFTVQALTIVRYIHCSREMSADRTAPRKTVPIYTAFFGESCRLLRVGGRLVLVDMVLRRPVHELSLAARACLRVVSAVSADHMLP